MRWRRASGDLPFKEMEIDQLKKELAARCSTRTGLKAHCCSSACTLRLVQAEIERRAGRAKKT